MPNDLRRLTTEAEREWLHLARRRGGLCAACWRPLGDDEPVCWERFMVDIDRSAMTGLGHYATILEAPVGTECASSDFLREVEGQDPERCAGCGRQVYYRTPRALRRRALCSRRCAATANRTTRRSMPP
jgi:hypothetical protein